MLKARPSAQRGLRIAITGFGPFPGVPFNASQRLIADLAEAPPRLPHGAQLYAAALPTDWRLGLEALAALLDSVRPHIALHFGVSSRATGFAIETRAFNQTSARPDCSGALAGERCLRRGGPAFVDTRLPAARLVQRLRMEGIAAGLSADPGRYLCNAVMFQSLCGAERTGVAVSRMKRNPSREAGLRGYRHRGGGALGTGQRADLRGGRGETVGYPPAQNAPPITGFIHIPALVVPDAHAIANGFSWPELRRGAAIILDTLARSARSG